MTPRKKDTFKVKEFILNYGVYLAFASAVFTGGYKVFAEPLIKDTAKTVAIEVADSVVSAERARSDSTNQKMYVHLKIIHNYMKLQDKNLFKKAKELEED